MVGASALTVIKVYAIRIRGKGELSDGHRSLALGARHGVIKMRRWLSVGVRMQLAYHAVVRIAQQATVATAVEARAWTGVHTEVAITPAL